MDGRVSGYRTVDVPVDGGMLRVGVWGPSDAAQTVLAIHGVTASHLAWAWLAEQLPQVRIIAPDLRGRGRSNTVNGPVGMAAHADDLAAVLAADDAGRAAAGAADAGPVDVVGHSMGAFVALVFRDRHPDRVQRLLLVDGGLPLDLPAGISPRDAVRHVLGPTAARLSRTFASEGEYFDFWRGHPAFARNWSVALEHYFAYDLVGEEPQLRPATRIDTVEEDSVDQNAGGAIETALARLGPTLLIAAERGLLDETPPLYSLERRTALVEEHPSLDIIEAANLNHYTIVMSARGAKAMAGALSA